MTEGERPIIEEWENIARVFNSEAERFRKRHGRELKKRCIVFYVRRGRPPRRTVAAFYDDLKLWAREKMRKGEVV